MISQHGNTSLSAIHKATIIKEKNKTVDFMGFFVCFPVIVIKTHIAWDIFHTGKFSLLLLASLLKVYFIVKASFFQVFTEETENNSHLSASDKVPLWKPFTASKPSLHPRPITAALGREGRGQTQETR